MKVKKDWWKTFFDRIYLLTDARTILNPLLTSYEVDLLEKLLKLKKEDKILDLCGGQARHSLELAKRGYKDLTVGDYSLYLLNLGRRLTKKSGYKIKFFRTDARTIALKKELFSAIFIMANSFGYCSQEKENLKILKEVYRLLKKKGRFLLDLIDPEHTKKKLPLLSWYEIEPEIVVCRKREFSNSLIKVRELVLSKKRGLLEDRTYSEHIYPAYKIRNLLKTAGFRKLTFHRIPFLKKKAYGLLGSRIMVTALRP